MANNKAFKIKNGLSATRYLGTNGTETAGSEGYSLAAASYDSKNLSISAQSGQPYDVRFKSDGTAMYVVDPFVDKVFQYTLSTAWDVSTGSYASKSFTTTTQDGTPLGFDFKSDGTKMYIVGATNKVVYQYSLSTAWDVSTASYDSVSLSVTSQDSSPRSAFFKSDGTKLYIMGNTNQSIFQYSLSTAWDLSTASYDSKSFSVSAQDTNPQGVFLNSDGTKLFMQGVTNGDVYQYSLGTAYDISTASYDSVSFDLNSQIVTPFGVAFKPDGTKMYSAEFGTGEAIYQYSTVAYTQTLDLSTGHTFSFTPSGATTVSFTNPPASGLATGFAVEVINTGGYAITWPSSVKWHLGTAPTATATKEIYTFITTDGGTTYYGKKAGENVQ